MLRTALKPRWLALLLVVLAAATGMAMLGQWQLDRARERGRPKENVTLQRVEPVEQVLRARQSFPARAAGQRVSATGRWDGARRQLIGGRLQDGRTGYWVLVPLRLADGSALPVVRGWVAGRDDPAAAGPAATGPAGTEPVTVTGYLEPAEPPAARAPGQSTPGGAADELTTVSVVDLLPRWPYPLLTGYMLAQAEQPATIPAPARVAPPKPSGGLALQNLSYAVQWWVFAGFGLFLWFRLVRDDHLGRLPGAGDDAPAPPVREEAGR